MDDEYEHLIALWHTAGIYSGALTAIEAMVDCIELGHSIGIDPEILLDKLQDTAERMVVEYSAGFDEIAEELSDDDRVHGI